MSRIIAREAPPGQIRRLCAAAGLSRATVYRNRDSDEPDDPDGATPSDHTEGFHRLVPSRMPCFIPSRLMS